MRKTTSVKIGTLFLVSVMALASASASYALWFENLYIEGTVTTGSFDVDWSIEDWYDDEIPEKDVSYVEASISDDWNTLFVTIYNAYPCITYTVEFDLHCVGTVPAHFTDWDFDYGNCDPSWITITPLNDEVTTQLHQGEHWYGTITIHLDNDAVQNSIYYFSITTIAYQYNEYPPSENIPPTADAGGPYSGHTCVPITFDGSGSYDLDGSIVSYEWDMDGDGEYDDATGVTTTHSWSTPGDYQVGLKVTDDDGATGTDTATITVEEQTPPQPFFVAPNPNTMVHGEVYLEVGDFSGASVDYTTFSYSSDGTTWTVIDTDYDSSDNCNPGETIPPVEFGDGWSTIWDIDDPDNPISEGWYYLKAEMVDPCGDIGSTMISVYVDPTPPCPTLQGVSDGDTVSGDVALTLATDDENIAYAIIDLLPIPGYWKREVPELDQDDYCNDMDGWDLSDSACGPTAAAACLLYWNSTGLFPNLMKNGTTEYINTTEFVEELARLMRLTSKGTNGSQVKKGIEAYLTRAGYGCTNPNGLKVTLFKNTTANPLNYTRWREELAANEEDVIWGYTSPWANHWITATSFNTTEQTDADGNKYHEVDFMCPSVGNDTARMYANGSLYRPNHPGHWRYPDEMITVSEKDPDEGEWFTIEDESSDPDTWLFTWDTTDYDDGYYLLKAVMVDETEWECQDVVVVKVENEGPQPPENSIVCGYIRNENNDPFEGVHVNVWSHDYEWGNDTQTDDTGYYEMNTIAGNLGLHVHMNGYFDEHIDWFYIEDGGTEQFDFTLQPKPSETSTIWGYVNDSEDNNPIGGVWVSLHDAVLDCFANGTETDSDGYYEIGIYAGSFYIDTDKDGYFQYHDEIDIGDYETLRVDILLEQKSADTSIVCGYVNNTDGELIADADVWLHDLDRDIWANGTLTNDIGYYKMGIYGGQFNIGVRKEGHFEYHQDIYVPDGQTIWKNITLEKIPPETSIIKGYIKDENGNPLQPSDVIIVDFIRQYVNNTGVDGEGYYEINVWAGRILVSTGMDGYDSNTTRVDVGENEVIWNNITLYPENAWVHGYVTDIEGNPLEDINIILYNTYSSLLLGDNVATTDENGYYNISLHEGYYIIFIAKVGGGWPFGMGEYDSLIFEVDIPLDQDVNISRQLELAPEPSPSEVFANFSDWDHLNALMRAAMASVNQSKILRLYIDHLIGDGDYFLNESEYEEFIELWMSSGPGGGVEEGYDTRNQLTVDDIYYNFEDGTTGFENFTGWWNQTTMITSFNEVNYTSNETIPTAPSHIFKLNVTYKDYGGYVIVHVDFPDVYGMISYNAMNVTITGVTNITILPGGDPNPDDDITWEWVEMVIVKVHIQSLHSRENIVDATAVADTVVNVNTTGDTSITIGKYPFNPHPEDQPPYALNKYVEIDIENESTVEWPINITFYYTQQDLNDAVLTEGELVGIYFWNDTADEWQLYNVTGVNTTDQNGYAGYCWAEAWHLTPLGSGGNKPPTAYIDSISPNPATEGQTVSFSGHGVDTDGTVTEYNWSSIDGQLSTQKSFSTSGLSTGTHTISFKVRDNLGAWSTPATATLTINQVTTGGDTGDGDGTTPSAPIADANGPYYEPLEDGVAEVTFNGTGSSGSIDSYSWDFGDNTTGTGVSPTHNYTALGNFTVNLTVTGPGGSDIDQTFAIISEEPNLPPIAPVVSGPQTGSKNTDYNYTAVSTDDDNDTLQYIFDWGDGTNSTSDFAANATAVTQMHNWSIWGIYTIKVNASDSKTYSGTTEYVVLIDVLYVKNIGYLIDTNSNGTYDKFYSNETAEQTSVEKLANGSYLINSDTDSEWDWIYDPPADNLSPYVPPSEPEEKEEDYTLWYYALMILLIIILLIIAAAMKKKKKPKKKPGKPKK